jgi:hypothetical protein
MGVSKGKGESSRDLIDRKEEEQEMAEDNKLFI